MKLTLHYELECSADQFWALYFDDDFTLRLHRQALASTSVEIVEVEGNLETGLTRTLRYGQRPDAPGPVKKLFGDEIVTTERATFDPKQGTSTFVLTPGTLADKTDIHGVVTIEGDGGRCRQRFELEAKVKIFGVGPVVERFIERQARSTQDKAVAFLRSQLPTG